MELVVEIKWVYDENYSDRPIIPFFNEISILDPEEISDPGGNSPFHLSLATVLSSE